jgi:hypothetical protein
VAQREVVFPGLSPIVGGGRIVPSPSAFYVTGEDRLRIVSVNSLTGVSLKLQWRFANPDGQAIPSSQDHTPNTNRSVKTQDYQLGIGALLNITVFASSGAPRVGQTYVMVQLVRGFGTAAIVLGTLLAGYVTSTQALGFPGSPIASSLEGGGLIRTIQGATPAPGAEFRETVPTGARWQLLEAQGTLTTSAAAGARRPILVWSVNGAQVGASAQVTDVNPSGGGTFNWAQGMPLAAAIFPGTNVVGLPMDLQLLDADFFASQTSGLAAGDQWTLTRYMVREWLEVT